MSADDSIKFISKSSSVQIVGVTWSRIACRLGCFMLALFATPDYPTHIDSFDKEKRHPLSTDYWIPNFEEKSVPTPYPLIFCFVVVCKFFICFDLSHRRSTTVSLQTRNSFICFVCSFPFYFLFFLISARDKQASKIHVKVWDSEDTRLGGHATGGERWKLSNLQCSSLITSLARRA